MGASGLMPWQAAQVDANTLTKPRVFGEFLFQKYWLPIEIVSFLLLIALVGALYLGKAFARDARERKEAEK